MTPCLRCGELPAAITACVAEFRWVLAVPGSVKHLGAVSLCDLCAMTLLDCLEKGTRFVPIVSSKKKDLGVYVAAENVVCVDCREHPPCRCGRNT